MNNDPLSVIQNYLRISDTITTAGQPIPPQFKLIREAGFEVVINLSTSTAPGALLNELDLVQENQMAYVYIPVAWQEPRQENLVKFFSFLSINQEFCIFCHCSNNMRVSVFVYLYRILMNHESEEECHKDLLKIWTPNKVWQSFIDRMLIELKGKVKIVQWPLEW